MKRFFRANVLFIVLVLIAAGCGSQPKEAEKTTGSYGAGIDLDAIGKKKKLKPQEVQAVSQNAAEQHPDPAPAPQGGGDPFKPDLTKKAIDNGSTGANAYFYLNKVVPRLVIEVDAVKGFGPSQASMTLLNQRLTGVADKPGGIQIMPVDEVPGQADGKWSDSDISATENANRNFRNSKDTAVIYLLFVNGAPQSPGALGVAYSSSADVIYMEQVRGAGTPVVTAEMIEKTVVIHEVGHLLALVNQTYKSPRDHEDPEHRGHSKNRESVMYWALESVNIVALLGGSTEPPTAFDKDDLADLADLKTGKLG